MSRVKVEIIYTIQDDEIQTETDRLTQHAQQFRLACRGRNAAVPHYDSLQIAVERKSWNPVS